MQHLSLKTSAEAEYVEGKCPRLREALTQKYQPFYFSKPMGRWWQCLKNKQIEWKFTHWRWNIQLFSWPRNPESHFFKLTYAIPNTLATSCKELTHWKRPWCWEGLGAGGEGDDKGWDGWMASPTRWTWVWVNSGNWWWTGRPGVLRFMGSQRVRHDWATELNWCYL